MTGINLIPLEQLEKWRVTCDKATPGPWVGKGRYKDELYAIEYGCQQHVLHANDYYAEIKQCDTDFICAARDAMPQLITAVGLLQKEIDQLRALLDRYKKLTR